MNGITDALNKCILRLAERQIQITFEQSEKEVQDFHQRIREGIETARLQGKQISRQRGRRYRTKKEMVTKKVIRKNSGDVGGLNSDLEVMRIIGISRNTYYKYKRELLEEGGEDG